MKITSPLRYPGGKAKALEYIMPLIPSDFSEYREPFLGGASVFVSLKQRNPNLFCRINDKNHDVYCFWKTLQENPNKLINAILQVKRGCKDGRSLYTKLASAQTSDVFGRALRFYILNRISFSGTVDSGGYSAEAFEKRFTLSRIETLLPLANLLKENVEVTEEDYMQLLVKEGQKVFIFLDPPYWNARKSSLYGKNGRLNKSFDHEEFAKAVKECKHKWLITCDDSPKIRKLFKSLGDVKIMIKRWKMQYVMNNKKSVLGKELFITNYEPTIQTTFAPSASNESLGTFMKTPHLEIVEKQLKRRKEQMRRSALT